jgi:hypothetical protein
VRGKPLIFDPTSEYAIQLRLEAVAKRLQQELATPPPKKRRKQAKPAQARIWPKLRAKWSPRGKPPKGMSTSEVCRQAGIPDSQRRSVHRLLGREPEK